MSKSFTHIYLLHSFAIFVRHNTDGTSTDQLCQGDSHQVYQKPLGTPGLHGDGVAGHRGAQWSIVQAECTRECSGKNTKGMELFTAGSIEKGELLREYAHSG